MALNMKIGVDMGEFRTGINDAKAHLKTLNAEMKLAESTFKATGDAEQALATKTTTLTNKLTTQKQMVAQYEKALKTLKDANAENTKEYKNLETEMLNAKAAMMDTQSELNSLDSTTQKAAGSANQFVTSMNSIGKKISLDQVISGIGSITSGLETAASKAIALGESIWDNVMNSAKWADDTATMAAMWGIDVEKFQQMQKLVTNGMDTTVESMLGAQSKLKKGIGSDSKAVSEALEKIGVSMTTVVGQGKYGPIEQAKDSLELFWEVGEKILNWGDENDREDLAQTLFGKSWRDLMDLFTKYKSVEEYNAALEEVQINSAEDVEKLAALNDKVSELEGNLTTLKNSILAQLAPVLTDASEVLNGVLENILDYLKTDKGQEMLQSLSDSVSSLFSSLGEIDPESVVENFVSVFEKLTSGLQWISQNSGAVIGALESIVIGWGALKLTGGALNMLKLVEGLNSLRNNGMPQLPGTEPSAPAADASGAAGKGSMFWTNLLGNLATKVTSLAAADPTGALALLPQVIMDRTIFGRHLTNGESVWKAAAASGQGFLNSAQAGLENLWKYISTDIPNAVYGLFGTDKDKLAETVNNFLNPGDSGGHGFALYVEPEVPEDAAKKLEEEIGTLSIPVSFVPADEGHDSSSGNEGYGGGGGGGGTFMFDFGMGTLMSKFFGHHANGLPYVPYDGYLATLHRGEQVIPAREVGSSRNFSSNLYVENMNMHNGQDAEGLASAMAAAQRRTMNGFGS